MRAIRRPFLRDRNLCLQKGEGRLRAGVQKKRHEEPVCVVEMMVRATLTLVRK
jgi:hypothetical protein